MLGLPALVKPARSNPRQIWRIRQLVRVDLTCKVLWPHLSLRSLNVFQPLFDERTVVRQVSELDHRPLPQRRHAVLLILDSCLVVVLLDLIIELVLYLWRSVVVEAGPQKWAAIIVTGLDVGAGNRRFGLAQHKIGSDRLLG